MRFRRILSSWLALCLVLTMLPTGAMAVSENTEDSLLAATALTGNSDEDAVNLFQEEQELSSESDGTMAVSENTEDGPLAVTASAGDFGEDAADLLEEEPESFSESAPVEIGPEAERESIAQALRDGGENSAYDGTRFPDDTETEIGSDLAVIETDAPDDDAEVSLFDGAPAYGLDEKVSLVPEDSGLDGAADEDWEELLKSFDSQPEISGIAGSAGGSDAGLDGSTTPVQAGELDGGEDSWKAPALTVENGGATLPDGGSGSGTPDGDLDGGSAPNGYYFEISSTRCATGGYITLYTEFSNTTSAYLIVKNRSSGKSVSYGISAYVRYRLDFPSDGNYALYLILYNRYGRFDGSQHNGTLYVKSGQAPKAYWMSLSAGNAAVNQVVTVRIDRKNATKATLVVKNLDNNNVVYRDTVDSFFQCKFTGAGRFTFHLVTENEFGTYDGSQHSGMTLQCNVSGAPTAYSWHMDGKSTINAGETTRVQVTDLGSATKATAILERSGTAVARCTFTGPTGIDVKLDSPGTYKLYLITQNNYGTYNGKSNNRVLTITAKGSPSDYWMSINKTSSYTGEQLNFSIDPRDSSYFYFVIEKDGTVIYKGYHGLARGINYTPSEAGSYRFYLITYNSYGSFNGGTHNGYSLTCTVRSKSSQRSFTATTNGYRFSNWYDDLGYPYRVENNTYVSLSKISLASYQSVFGSTIGYVRWLSAGTWGGSCFGFASTAAWAYQYPSSNFSSRFNSNTMYGISAPRNQNSAMTTTLERYQLSQSLSAVSRESSANENNVTALADAVEAVENGGRMVILGVFRSIPGSSSLGGHALVPYRHDTTGSTHNFYVYDCNRPGEEMKVTMTANSNGKMRTFQYNSGSRIYDHSFDFTYADTVRSALPSAARDGAAKDDDTLTVILGGNPGTVSCVGLSGAVDLSQYEVYLLDSDLNGRLYDLPSGNYTLTCVADNFQEFTCSAANSASSASAAASGTRVVFSVGNTNGNVQCSARSDRQGALHMSLVNSAGQMSCLDGEGTYLGAVLDSAGQMQASSDQEQVEHNGKTLNLSWSGGGSSDLDGVGDTASAYVDPFLDGTSEPWSIESTSSVRLILTEDGITGTLTLLTRNPGGMAERELLVEAFDADGNFIGRERVQTAIGAYQSAVRITLTGGIKLPEKISSGALTFKVTLVPQSGEETADAALFEKITLADDIPESGMDGAVQQLSITGTDSVHLALTKGGITGTLNLTTANPEQAVEREVFVAAYDASGRMLGVEKSRMLILEGSSTTVITLGGSIHLDKETTGALKFKVFLPDSGMAPLCGEAVFHNVKVDGIE